MRKQTLLPASRKNLAAISIFLIATAFFSTAIFAQAQNIGVQIPLQGLLKDPTGKPLTGTYDLKFEIFSNPTTPPQGEISIWYETQSTISVSRGRFQVYLGKGVPLTDALATDNLLYVQISIKTPEETTFKTLSPRIILNPTFAKVHAAKNIDSIDASKIISGILDIGRIPGLAADKITSGILDAARVPSLDAGKINSGTLSADRVPTLAIGKMSFISAGVASKKNGETIDFSTKSFGVSSFTNTPVVVCSSIDSYICAAESISTTGFTVKLTSHNGNRPASAISVNWIAIGS